MANPFNNEPMLDMYIFETSQLLEQLEQSALASEKSSGYTQDAINEIFRIMHTIKGSSSMMMFNNIATVAHSIEDLFFFIRDDKPVDVDCSTLSDLVFEVVDFIKVEIEKIKSGDGADGDSLSIIKNIKDFLAALKEANRLTGSKDNGRKGYEEKHQYYISPAKIANSSYHYAYKAVIFFDDGCEMENIRAYAVIHSLKEIADEIYPIPEDIIENDLSAEVIRREGFQLYFKADDDYDKMRNFLMQTVFLKKLELEQLNNDDELKIVSLKKKSKDKEADDIEQKEPSEKECQVNSTQQSIVSVSVSKLDRLMDLVGEMVIAEAMVIQNPDLRGHVLDNFQKAAQQLNKITSEIQDMVMSIRMVALSTTFHKMHRIVRDMCKKLGKEIELDVVGEETEVDKNIIEHISDPLMHLVRNSIDHGIEPSDEREAKGKSSTGKIILEAKNSGSDVLIMVKDDGRGLNKETLLKKARENNLLYKPETDMSDKEIFSLIFLPGFSTKDRVTEFSGRGVGMDVVTKNIDTIGGSVSIESTHDKGTTIILKIPLTLAIIDGMNIKVGNSRYTLPTISIRESFRPKENDIITDPDGHEMIMVRGQCYPILRLHERYKVKTEITSFCEGILIMIEQDNRMICIFADELLGQQQVVVKALPEYIRKFKKVNGLAGCTLLGDGNISLILDVGGLMKV